MLMMNKLDFRKENQQTQIFTLRRLIETAKKTNITLYIGCFDIEKVFDKVSRYLMLKKLIKCGIGSAMLCALKSIYTVTSCNTERKMFHSIYNNLWHTTRSTIFIPIVHHFYK